jgi:hypothetical protein
MRRTLLLLLAPCLASCMAPPALAQEVRAVTPEYYQRMAEREKQLKVEQTRNNLSYSRLEPMPERPTEGHTLRLKVGVWTGATPQGQCADANAITWLREGKRIKVNVPAAPCANSAAAAPISVDVAVGRLPPGEYAIELDVANDIGLSPVKSVALKVRPFTNDMDRLVAAVEESAGAVSETLAAYRYDQDSLDAALNHACQWEDAARSDKAAVARVLVAAGAKPVSAIHGAAHGSTQCLRALLAAGADPNIDIATLPGVRLGTGPNALRFKPGPAGTPLFFAVHSLKEENMRVLLDAGADPNRTFGSGHSAYAESHVIGDSKAAMDIRKSLEARGGTLSLVQRASLATGMAGGIVKGAGFLAICQLAAWMSGSCMH